MLEVLIAMAILGVGILGAMQLFPSSLRQARAAAERRDVASLATAELGRLQAVGNTGGFCNWVDQNTVSTANAIGNIGAVYSTYYTWQSAVQCMSGAADLYRVTLSVRMMDGRVEKFVTYVSRR